MIITIDTGGTKTLVASFDVSGNPTNKVKFPTPQDPKEYTNKLNQTLKENFSNQSIEKIVVAIPGTLDKNNTIIWCPNLPQWKGFNISNKIDGVFKSIPILVENDAKLAGLYEAKILNPIPENLLYVTISTGIGTGIITNGHIDHELRDSEGGRSLIEFEGKIQEWQNFASGKSFHETFNQYMSEIVDDNILQQIAKRISLGFLMLIPTLQPDIVVIGGSVGTYFYKIKDKLLAIFEKELPPHIPCPKFISAKNSEEAVIYGCYYYALEESSNT